MDIIASFIAAASVQSFLTTLGIINTSLAIQLFVIGFLAALSTVLSAVVIVGLGYLFFNRKSEVLLPKSKSKHIIKRKAKPRSESDEDDTSPKKQHKNNKKTEKRKSVETKTADTSTSEEESSSAEEGEPEKAGIPENADKSDGDKSNDLVQDDSDSQKILSKLSNPATRSTEIEVQAPENASADAPTSNPVSENDNIEGASADSNLVHITKVKPAGARRAKPTKKGFNGDLAAVVQIKPVAAEDGPVEPTNDSASSSTTQTQDAPLPPVVVSPPKPTGGVGFGAAVSSDMLAAFAQKRQKNQVSAVAPPPVVIHVEPPAAATAQQEQERLEAAAQGADADREDVERLGAEEREKLEPVLHANQTETALKLV